MKSFIKVGNSEILWSKNGVAPKRFSADNFLRQLENFKHQEVRVVSVVPTMERRIRVIARNSTAKFKFVTAKSLNYSFSYSNGLGADRALNIFSLSRMSKNRKPKVLIDLGTAITVDFLDSQNQHRGGWISAGLRLGFESLNQKTAALPNISMAQVEIFLKSKSTRPWGHSTKDCMLHGQTQQVMGLIERARSLSKKQFQGPPQVILTGGWANLITLPSTKSLPLLWLQGLQSLE